MDSLGKVFRKWRANRGFSSLVPRRVAETRPVSRPPRPILSTMDAPVGHGHPVPVTTPICAVRESSVNIDYSDILPGDDAPDLLDPAAGMRSASPSA